MNYNNTYNTNDDILTKVKVEIDEIEVPDELLPENMMKKLEKVEIQPKKKDNRKVIAITSILSVAAMLIVVISIAAMYFGIFDGENSEKDIISDAELKYEADEKGFYKFTSYEKLHKYLLDAKIDNELVDIIFPSLDGSLNEEDIMTSVPENNFGSSSSSKGEYSDTNERTEGVGEGDCVKTDGKYIYIANDEYIKIVEAGGENSKLINILEPLKGIETWMENEEFIPTVKELFVVDNKLIAIIEVLGVEERKVYNDKGELVYTYSCVDSVYARTARTVIRTYDIGDISNVSMIGDLAVDGTYDSTRVKEGYLYVFSSKYILQESYIPKNNEEDIPANSVYVSEYSDYQVYAIMSSVEINNPDKFVDNKAVIHSNMGEYYVSEKNIYLYAREYINGYKTEIMKFEYKDGKITAIVSKCVDGELKDSFCIDEYNGYLRLVVTITNSANRSNSVYVLDNELNKIGEIKDIAKDESIYSARFMGDVGYFVTYLQVDPLFSVDLSDPYNPKIVGALKIPGFSEYLHAWGEGKLLGLGRENEYMKLSMFDISNPYDVTEQDKSILEGIYYSPAEYDYKAVLIDYDKNIIGFAAEYGEFVVRDEQSKDVSYEHGIRYVIYKYGEGGFECVSSIGLVMDYGSMHNIRGLFIDDNIYIVEPNSKVTVLDMEDFSVISSVIL